ncbi:hypothetical protein Tco_0736383 [Tanacetum coccineum]
MALGYQTFLSQASSADNIRVCNNGSEVFTEKHDPPTMYDSEETLQLAQESRLKMKHLNKEIKPTNYAKINHTLDPLSQKLENENVELEFQTSREEKFVPNKPIKASVGTKKITISQPHVITKKDVNADSNGLSSIGVDNTVKTRRPQPRSNTKNIEVPSASKSSCSKNK